MRRERTPLRHLLSAWSVQLVGSVRMWMVMETLHALRFVVVTTM